jgi:uncharacterized protein (DUF169 family)
MMIAFPFCDFLLRLHIVSDDQNLEKGSIPVNSQVFDRNIDKQSKMSLIGRTPMETWIEIGNSLEMILRPKTYPLAVKLVKDESGFPPKTRRPEGKLAICQALTISRKYGWTMGITGEDNACPGSNLAYGWPTPEDDSLLEQFFLFAGYVANEAGAKKIVAEIDRLPLRECGGMVISPLTRTKIVPDVILVYGNPAQIMRLIQGAMYKEGKRVRSDLSGVVASCTGGIIRARNTGEVQVAILGNGDRIFAASQDDEMLFAIPAPKAGEIIEGMRAQRFAKYPIPVAMQMPPPFPGMPPH